MSSVDDRIVNMKFNNSQFSQGVDKTKRDLTGLEKSVTGMGKTKGMSQLGQAAEGVRVKFSALQVAGTAALATIASKATLAAGNLIKKFTIQPILDGFREYQTGLESVQTIMTNTGKSVDVVNKKLDELNDFSDQTIYNFGQMAKNIGTFTAAGVDLNTSTSAIKGIANIAAASGASSEKASRAMYQLSQAIAAGKVGLMDWNSVVNADMGGKLFKERLAQTAVAMGDLSAGAVKVGTDVEIMGQSFRNSISAAAGQESWLTSDVLVKTLASMDGRFSSYRMKLEGINGEKRINNELDKARAALAKQGVKYTDEEFDNMVKTANKAFKAATVIKTFPQLIGVVQESIGSMWGQAFEFIMGDFQESKKLWSNVGGEVKKIIDGISMNFLGALDIWRRRGGRDKILEGLGNMFGSLLDVMKQVTKAWRDVFPKSKIPGENVSMLFRLSKAFKSFTKNLVPSADTLDSLRSIFKGVFAVMHIGFTILSGLAQGFRAFFGEVFKGSESGRSGILKFLAGIGETLVSLDQWLTKGGKVTEFLKGIGQIAGGALAPVIAVIGAVVDAMGSIANGIALGDLEGTIDKVTDKVLGLGEALLTGFANITAPLGSVGDFIEDLRDKVASFRDSLNFSAAFGGGAGAMAVGGLSGMFDSLRAGAESVSAFVREKLTSISDAFKTVSDAGSSVGDQMSISFDRLSGAADSVKTSTEGVYAAVAGPTAAAAATSTDKVSSAAERVGGAFSSVGGVLKTVAQGIGDALGWMVEKLSSIPFPDDALEWASVLNTLISAALIKRLFFSKGLFGELKDTISEAGKSFQNAMGDVSSALGTLQNSIRAEMIRNIAIAVALLVASLVVMAFMPADKLMQGVKGLAAAFAVLGAMLFVLSKINTKMSFAAVAAGLVAMATGILILTGAIAILGNMDPAVLEQGLSGLSWTLVMLTAAVIGMSKAGAGMFAVGAALVAMGVAINILTAAIYMLGSMNPDTLSQGLEAVAKGIAIMTISLLALSAVGPRIMASGAAMVLMATALDILVAAIAILGALPADVIQQGLDAISYALLGMTASLLALSLAGPATLAAGAAMVMMAFALGMLAPVLIMLGTVPFSVISQGLQAMASAFAIMLISSLLAMSVLPGLAALTGMITAIGLAMLATGAGFFLFATGLALIAAVGTAAFAVITVAIGAFIALLPNIAVQMAAAFVSFLQAIALAAPKIRKAFTTIMTNMLEAARENFPKVGQLVREGLSMLIDILVSFFPAFYESMWRLLEGLLQSIEDHLPKVIDSAYEIAYAIIDGMGQRAVDLANAGADALIEMLNGLTEAVETKGPLIREAMGNLAEALGRELKAAAEDILGDINLSAMLPDISLPDIRMPKILGGDGKRAARDDDRNLEDDYDSMVNSRRDKDKDKDKDKDPGKGPGKNTFAQDFELAGLKVAAAIKGAVGLLVGAMSGNLFNQLVNARGLRFDANKSAVTAERRDATATLAEETAGTMMTDAKAMKQGKKGTKAAKKRAAAIKKAKTQEKKAREQRRIANEAAQKALKDQITADYEEQNAMDAVTYKDDIKGYADARSSAGQDLAVQSAEVRASSEAKLEEAKRLDELAKTDKKNAKKYRQEAAQLRKDAAAETAQSLQLSTQAIQAQEQAVAAYALARKEAAQVAIADLAAIREQQAQEAKDRAWQEKYDSLKDTSTDPAEETKETMLNARIAENQKKADDAQAKLNEQLAIGDALAAQIAANPDYRPSDAELAAVEAAALEAQKQAAIVSQALTDVEADKDAVEQLVASVQQNNTTTGGGSNLTPSRTALEDAMKAVDRYTASVAQAEEMAGAGASTTQYIQNNYSPEALSASTIYRQSKNLISAAEIKIGADA